ncbi:MAG: UDP-glucose--hexose-1-phosphate uridylyltransferase [Clostridia bacterium]
MINLEITKLVAYGLEKGLVKQADKIYTTNMILGILGLDDYEEVKLSDEVIDLEDTLKNILDYAVKNKLIEDGVTSRDLFDTKLMGAITPKPSEVIENFNKLYEQDPKKATEYFYGVSTQSDYIRTYRVKKDLKWVHSCDFGDLDITINLAKPEKDNKAIAAQINMVESSYPKCMLCKENMGYAGRINHPARQNLRTIPVLINNEDWFFQYSPYVYYNEHCIVFKGAHNPMKIDRATFRKLLDFVKIFPHYFVGSNSDLPIVGGSILSHDHFQGGNYEFAMERAEIHTKVSLKGFDDVNAGLVKWPMSVIRLSGKDDSRLVELADVILKKWRAYSDESSNVFAFTDEVPHNTITPIARKKGENFELDLVLRNNLCTEEHPDGLYHPHAELHNIKKEGIGLIEVMGLAVLPSRLKAEIAKLSEVLVKGEEIPADLQIHADWANGFRKNYNITSENVSEIIEHEIGVVFAKVLNHAGVYKCDGKGIKGFLTFIDHVNM